MKKILSLAIASTMCVGLLGGCTQTEKDTTQTNNQQTENKGDAQDSNKTESTEKVKLKLSAWDIDSSPTFTDLVNEYNAQHPDVEIELVDLGSTDYTTVLATQLAGGSSDIDIITVKDIPSYASLLTLGMLEPLNDLHTVDTAKYNGTIEQLTVDGKYYAAPFRTDYWLLYYNKDLFDQAGVAYPSNDLTLPEYDAMVKQLTSGTGSEKVYGSHYHVWRSAVQLFSILDGKNSIITDDYTFLKPYYERVLEQQREGICQDYAALKTANVHYSGVFYNNQVATMNMGSWFMSSQMEKVASGESLAKNWGVVKYPHPEGAEQGATLGTITSFGINAKSKHKDIAKDFINFATGEEGAVVVAKTGSFPAIMSDEALEVITGAEGYPTDENSKEALKGAKIFFEMPLDANSAAVELVLNQVHDNIMTENITVDEGIAQLNEEVSAIINK